MKVNSFSRVCHALNMAVSVLKSFKVTDADADKFAAFISDLESALKTHRRNCEVGTDNEQIRRWKEFCDHYEVDRSPESFARWAQGPYFEEGGAK